MKTSSLDRRLRKVEEAAAPRSRPEPRYAFDLLLVEEKLALERLLAPWRGRGDLAYLSDVDLAWMDVVLTEARQLRIDLDSEEEPVRQAAEARIASRREAVPQLCREAEALLEELRHAAGRDADHAALREQAFRTVGARHRVSSAVTRAGERPAP